jgi:hypothetical protein
LFWSFAFDFVSSSTLQVFELQIPVFARPSFSTVFDGDCASSGQISNIAGSWFWTFSLLWVCLCDIWILFRFFGFFSFILDSFPHFGSDFGSWCDTILGGSTPWIS